LKPAFSVIGIALLMAVMPARAVSAAATVGLIPADSSAVTEALADGARLAFEQAAEIDGLAIELVVASGGTHWSTASAPAVELAFGSEVVALITPPDRATAHLIAQIGSRAHIPVLTTTRAQSIGGTGSYWVIPLVELVADTAETILEPQPPQLIDKNDSSLLGFESAFRNRFDREPDGWAAIGYRAGAAVCGAVRDDDLDRYRIVHALRAVAAASANSASAVH